MRKEIIMPVHSFGSLNLDYVYAVDHFVQGGETMAALGRQVFAGGKGLNQSIALARAGVGRLHLIDFDRVKGLPCRQGRPGRGHADPAVAGCRSGHIPCNGGTRGPHRPCDHPGGQP